MGPIFWIRLIAGAALGAGIALLFKEKPNADTGEGGAGVDDDDSHRKQRRLFEKARRAGSVDDGDQLPSQSDALQHAGNARNDRSRQRDGASGDRTAEVVSDGAQAAAADEDGSVSQEEPRPARRQDDSPQRTRRKEGRTKDSATPEAPEAMRRGDGTGDAIGQPPELDPKVDGPPVDVDGDPPSEVTLDGPPPGTGTEEAKG